MTGNGVDNTDPFGFAVDSLNITTDNPVAIQDSTNPIINGPFGKVTGSILRNGTTMTLHPADNPNVRGLVWLSTADPSGTTGAFLVTSRSATDASRSGATAPPSTTAPASRATPCTTAGTTRPGPTRRSASTRPPGSSARAAGRRVASR